MKKTSKKRLKLAAQTIRTLSDAESRIVAGGGCSTASGGYCETVKVSCYPDPPIVGDA